MSVFSDKVKELRLGEIPVPSWMDQLGTISTDGATGIALDQAGNIYITGYTQGSFKGQKPVDSNLDNDIMLVKYNKQGEEVWRSQLGDQTGILVETPEAIGLDLTGNIYVAGQVASNAFLVKFDSLGQKVWQREFKKSALETAKDIAVDRSGAIYLTGTSSGFGLTGSNAFITKFDSQGNSLWYQSVDISDIDEGYGITIDKNDNLYITGITRRKTQGINVGENDFFVAKYNGKGEQQWLNTSKLAGDDTAFDITIDQNGNLYVAGSILVKIDPEGNLVWQQDFNGSLYKVTAIGVDSQNHIYTAGSTYNNLFDGYSGENDILLIKFDESGNILGFHQAGTIGRDTPDDLTIDQSDNVFVVGGVLGELGEPKGNYDGFVIKYGDRQQPKSFWRNDQTGQLSVGLVRNHRIELGYSIQPFIRDQNWQIQGVGDFNGDDEDDMVWRNRSTGQNVVWLMNEDQPIAGTAIPSITHKDWQIHGVGDFNKDGIDDLLWYNTTNRQTVAWYLDSHAMKQETVTLTPQISPAEGYELEGCGDFDGNDISDLLWRNPTTGENLVWLLENTMSITETAVDNLLGSDWYVGGMRDYNYDGKSDLMWNNPVTGQNEIWLMNGAIANRQGIFVFPQCSGLAWEMVG